MKRLRYALPFWLLAVALLTFSGTKFISVLTTTPTPLRLDAETSVHVTNPSSLVLWHYTEGVVEGVYHHTQEIPEGMRVDATFNGQTLPVQIHRGTTMTMSDGERKSIFSIPADQPGDYLIRIEHAPSHHRFAVTQGSGIMDFFVAFACGGLGFFLLFPAIVFSVLALTKTFPKT